MLSLILGGFANPSPLLNTQLPTRVGTTKNVPITVLTPWPNDWPNE